MSINYDKQTTCSMLIHTNSSCKNLVLKGMLPVNVYFKYYCQAY